MQYVHDVKLRLEGPRNYASRNNAHKNLRLNSPAKLALLITGLENRFPETCCCKDLLNSSVRHYGEINKLVGALVVRLIFIGSKNEAEM